LNNNNNNNENNNNENNSDENNNNNSNKFDLARMFLPWGGLSFGSVLLRKEDPSYERERDKRFKSYAKTPMNVLQSFAIAIAVFNVPLMCDVLSKVNPSMNAIVEAVALGFNQNIFIKCSTAIFKICVLCVIVSQMILKKRLPLETPMVVSKLAFNILLPCYLCTRVAGTLTKTPLNQSLMVLPFGALTQVLVGTVCGVLLTKVVANVSALSTTNNKKNDKESSSSSSSSSSSVDSVMPRLGLAACAFGNTFTYLSFS